MNVLHFAYVDNDPCSGVSVAVPKHILSQQELANVAFVNIAGCSVKGIRQPFSYGKGFSVSALPAPFCRPDLVVFHEVYRPPFLKIAKELRKADIPYIIVPHGCLTHDAQHKKFLKKKLGNALFFSEFIRHAAAIQCLSAQEHEATAYGCEHIISGNGVEMPSVRKSSFHTDRIECLFIGRMEISIKGLDLLTEAVALERETFRKYNAVLRLYGPQEQHGAVRELIRRYGAEELVELNDPVFGDEKRDVLLNADLFVQTSRSEGMPMGVLEALSYGLPCVLSVGTRVGERVEKAGAGWLCEQTAASVAKALRKAFEERAQWSSYSESAVTLIKNEFELSRIAEQTLDLYRRYVR